MKTLEILREAGLGFGLWNLADLKACQAVGIDPGDVHVLHPQPSAALVARAYAWGVRRYTAGSRGVLRLLAQRAPEAEVLLRVNRIDESVGLKVPYPHGLRFDNLQRAWFEAKQLGLTPHGIAFHLGSMLQSPEAFGRLTPLLESLSGWLPRAATINLGGGLPGGLEGSVDWHDLAPSLAETIAGWQRRWPSWRFEMEPGRVLVGDAGLLCLRIEGTGRGRGARLLRLDRGASAALWERCWGASHPLRGSYSAEGLVPTLLTGPEGLDDPLGPALLLPRALRTGDWLVAGSAGAYSTALAGPRILPRLWLESPF